jgi:ribose transport system ATP-binding protein
MKKELFRLEYLDINYKGSLRLEDFSMELYRGEVLGILTKNAREMDCLIEVMKGHKIPERGRISFEGIPLQNHRGLKDSPVIELGKQSQLIDDFKIADNIFVVRKGFRKFYISSKKLELQALIMLDKFSIKIPPSTYIKDLSNFDKLIVEIAKSHILKIPVIVLKSLTSFLSDDEICKLYPYIKKFQDSGQTFIVMDSTSSVIREMSTRIIVLNKGRNLWTFAKKDFSEEIISGFFNIEENEQTYIPASEDAGEEILTFRNVHSKRLNPLSAVLRKGEITGIIDPEGTQIEELKKIFLGEGNEYRGEIFFKNKLISAITPKKLLKYNIGIISEDPASTLLFPHFNALDNLSFTMGKKVPFFWQNNRYRENIYLKYESFFSPGSLGSTIKELTSSDLHTLAYLRWHLYSPDLLILIKPFSSVDRKMEDLTIKLMNELLKKRIGLVILSSNLWELSALSAKLPVKIERLPPIT